MTGSFAEDPAELETILSHPQQAADELDSEPATVHDVVLVRVDEHDYFR